VSAAGQKAPFDGQPITSGLPPGANILGGGWHVSSVPGHRSINWPRRIVVVPRPPSLYSSYMLRVIVTALVTLGFFVGLASVTRLPPSLAASGGETNPDMCNVVQAAFMAVMNSRDVAYPKEIGASSRSIGRIGTFFIAPAILGKDELSDLASQQDKYSIEHFTPVCDWRGKSQSVMDPGPMRVEFSNPIFSSDAKLAILQVSFQSSGIWGYGRMCVLRKADFHWIARCIPSWIS
jgi:hypothetical protein